MDELFTEDIQSAITLAGQEVRRDGVHIWYRVVHLQRRFLDNCRCCLCVGLAREIRKRLKHYEMLLIPELPGPLRSIQPANAARLECWE